MLGPETILSNKYKPGISSIQLPLTFYTTFSFFLKATCRSTPNYIGNITQTNEASEQQYLAEKKYFTE